MNGEGNGVFAPYRNVTRAEFATLISNALKLPEGNKSFVDINKAHPSLHSGIKRSASAELLTVVAAGFLILTHLLHVKKHRS